MTHILLMGNPGQGSGGLGTMLPFILIMVVFYFFMIYPQMKKSKAQKKFRENLAEGDKVVTVGGLHGKIEKMDETTFIINSEGTRLRIDRSSISMEASQALNAPKKDEK